MCFLQLSFLLPLLLSLLLPLTRSTPLILSSPHPTTGISPTTLIIHFSPPPPNASRYTITFNTTTPGTDLQLMRRDLVIPWSESHARIVLNEVYSGHHTIRANIWDDTERIVGHSNELVFYLTTQNPMPLPEYHVPRPMDLITSSFHLSPPQTVLYHYDPFCDPPTPNTLRYLSTLLHLNAKIHIPPVTESHIAIAAYHRERPLQTNPNFTLAQFISELNDGIEAWFPQADVASYEFVTRQTGVAEYELSINPPEVTASPTLYSPSLSPSTRGSPALREQCDGRDGCDGTWQTLQSPHATLHALVPPSSSNRLIILPSVTLPSYPSTSRPWTHLTLPRITSYARHTHSTLLVVTALPGSCEGEFVRAVEGGMKEPMDIQVALRWCSMKEKVRGIKKAVLSGDEGGMGYDAVMVVDDTVLVRSDMADLFNLVGNGVGGMVEGDEVRTLAERRLVVEASCDFYSVVCDLTDPIVINTGVFVVSKEAAGELFEMWNGLIDMKLYGDQGYVNAMLNRVGSGIAVVDFGYRYNWVGSFENVNRRKVEDISKDEVYAYHATTGLCLGQIESGQVGIETYQMMVGEEALAHRVDWVEGVEREWTEKGL